VSKPDPSNWREDKRSTAARGYGGRWQRARLLHLKAHPLCVMCQSAGIVRLGNVVDHVVPHRGDDALFWNPENWQTLCAMHHSSDKQALEKSGEVRTKFDANGRVIW
jgi:5-methylcytosine-specific restriction protein A